MFEHSTTVYGASANVVYRPKSGDNNSIDRDKQQKQPILPCQVTDTFHKPYSVTTSHRSVVSAANADAHLQHQSVVDCEGEGTEMGLSP